MVITNFYIVWGVAITAAIYNTTNGLTLSEHWSSWSTCSVSCNFGIKTRQKLCSRIDSCYASSKVLYERASCVVNMCSENGKEIVLSTGWAEWSQWTDCSGTCGEGSRRRQRFCPGTTKCGDKSDGYQTESCKSGRCRLEKCSPSLIEDQNCNFETNCTLWHSCSSAWKIGSSTPTLDTGPNFDTTFGISGCGSFLYLEGGELSDSHQAEFIYTKGITGEFACLIFNVSMFSMFPTEMGTLRVLQRSEASDVVLLEKDGSTGSRSAEWQNIAINLIKDSSNLNKIVFQATRGKGPRSDIAIDDIILLRNPCHARVDGNWVKWGDWSQCSAQCGCGTMHRRRTCTSPTRTLDGAECVGNAEETKPCDAVLPLCDVNGGWDTWTNWTPCELSCGVEYQHRDCECQMPVPVGNGKRCLVETSSGVFKRSLFKTQSRLCHHKQCPVFVPSLFVTPREVAASTAVGGHGGAWGGSSPAWVLNEINVDGEEKLYQYYFETRNKLSYNDAKTDCESKGAHLTSIVTDKENDFAKNMVKGTVFLGATRSTNSDPFSWDDGSEWSYNNVNATETNACVAIENSVWVTKACTDANYYVCKRVADLWLPWSDWSECSSTCLSVKGTKVKSRVCRYPEPGYDYTCIPDDINNVKRNQLVTVEFKSRNCYGSSLCPPVVLPDSVWSEWTTGETIFTDTPLQARLCSNPSVSDTCEQNDVDGTSAFGGYVQYKQVSYCDVGWELYTSKGGEKVCFFIESTVPKTHMEAGTDCSEKGGELATIYSPSEQNFLVAQINAIQECTVNGSCEYWIGGKYVSDHHTWNGSEKMGYKNLFQPSATPSNNSCLVMSQSKWYRWSYNSDCSVLKHYICKRYVETRRSCPENSIRYGDVCYHYIKNASVVWTGANARCQSLSNGLNPPYLASIPDNHALEIVIQLMGIDTEAWLGAVESYSGSWTWLNGLYWDKYSLKSGAVNVDGNSVPSEAGVLKNKRIMSASRNTSLPVLCESQLFPRRKCDPTWSTLYGPNDEIHCFRIVPKISSGLISGFCEVMSSEPAKLDTKYKNNFVRQMLSNNLTTTSTFIGIQASGGTFYWLDGSDVKEWFTSDGSPISYSGYPCVELSAFWKDKSCYPSGNVVCHKLLQ